MAITREEFKAANARGAAAVSRGPIARALRYDSRRGLIVITLEGGCEFASNSARQQYVDRYPEQPLLAFVLNETNQWLSARSQRNGAGESDKFVIMASMNLVNCIASAPIPLTAHG